MPAEQQQPPQSQVDMNQVELLPTQQGKSIFTVENNPVEVGWKKFVPHEVAPPREGVKNPATLLLMGWGMDEKAGTIGELTQHYADYGKSDAYAVASNGEKSTLQQEAEAVRQFAQKLGIDELTLVGFSMGGSKAIDLLAQIKKLSPEIKLRGLILPDSVSIHSQSKTELTAKFAWDSIGATPVSLLKPFTKFENIRKILRLNDREWPNPEDWKTLLRSTGDIVSGMTRDIIRAGLRYPKKVFGQIREMASLNPRLQDVDVPVIFVHGGDDPISVQEKLIPGVKDTTWAETTTTEDGSKENLRESILRRILPKAPYIRSVRGEKMAHHSLPLYRSEQLAKTSLYLLDRYWRSTSSSPKQEA